MESPARHWKNNIVGHAEVDPATLLPHPENWRLHPDLQQDMMRGALNDLGWLQSVTVSQRTGHLLDGHMRVILALNAGEPTVPVEYVDVTPQEERKALATINPLAELFVANQSALSAVLDQVPTGEDALDALFAKLRADHLGEAPAPTRNRRASTLTPRGVDQWIVAIDCADEQEQLATLEALSAQGYVCRALIS
jgi:hypothetical protein